MRQVPYVVMIPLLGLVAIVHSVVGPRLALGHVRPDLVLLVVLAWTLVQGSREGIVWGFVGGLWMDVLSGGPMGGSSLALMAAALAAGLGCNRFFRHHPIVPLLAAVAGTLVYAAVYLAILHLTGHSLSLTATVQRLVFPSVLYNGALMLLCTPLLNRIPDRRGLV